MRRTIDTEITELTDYRRTVRLAVIPARSRRSDEAPRTFEVDVFGWRAVIRIYRDASSRGVSQDLRAITYFALDAAEVAA